MSLKGLKLSVAYLVSRSGIRVGFFSHMDPDMSLAGLAFQFGILFPCWKPSSALATGLNGASGWCVTRPTLAGLTD